MNTTQSEKLYAQALDFMPGGVNSPVRACRSVDSAFYRPCRGFKNL